MTESQVYLRKIASNQMVDASLFDEITDEHLGMWKNTWVPMMEAYCQGRAEAESPRTVNGTGNGRRRNGGRI
ncbi:MAG TPA: hypothetical protein VH619_09820 [Verrucomicrobiae bacterium]|jgi:hypothetical protein|nr:hypothetical protein [Verrucomicrobiae bacterium]